MITRKRSGLLRDNPQLILLLVVLIAVIALMLYLQRLAESGGSLAPSGPDMASYHSPVHRFSMAAPNPNWSLTELSPGRGPTLEDPFLSVLENTTTVLQMRTVRDSVEIARVEVGMLTLRSQRPALQLAAECLQQLRQKYHTPPDTVRVILSVNPVISRAMEGAYFVAELPGQALPHPSALNVWVLTYVVREAEAYAILCRTSVRDYARVRDELAQAIESFRLR